MKLIICSKASIKAYGSSSQSRSLDKSIVALLGTTITLLLYRRVTQSLGLVVAAKTPSDLSALVPKKITKTSRASAILILPVEVPYPHFFKIL